MQQRTINSLSVKLYGDKKNPPIIFVHGFPFDHRMWINQLENLQNEFYCVAYDVRGLGDSYIGDGQYTMEAFVHDLFSIINELHLKNVTVCGLSMGGYIALRAVEMNQDKIKALILMDTKSEADDNLGKLKRAGAVDIINLHGLNQFVDQTVPSLFAEETLKDNQELVDRILGQCYDQDSHGVKGSVLAMVSRTDTTSFLANIKIPTLVMAGSFDTLTPPAMMRKMSEKIPNSEFAIVPRGGHMAPLENPDFVNDMIRGFLKKI